MTIKETQQVIIELLLSTKRENMNNMVSYLAHDGFFEAPASTKYHGAYPGGLAKHSLAVYEALGDTMLRDKLKLRSGEEWEPSLARMIEAADVFQLYWSAAAKASPNVEKEWRHALDLARRNFIRPLTWEQPEPEFPSDLSHLHFATLRIEL